jgi:hypothetical protein
VLKGSPDPAEHGTDRIGLADDRDDLQNTARRRRDLGVASFLLPKVTVETPTISREFLTRRA